ncbi:Fatty acid synthase like protein [Argiope bruennichi]|uniref:Fatty acid synthase n=1 Tax=Argiope bruennichi TaxID=94029 RepID=A0A8T0EKZ7_ARGBR|nr:Fatty acid synthase like protein [Argiope bruennichi]
MEGGRKFPDGARGVPYSSCALLKRLDQFDAEFFQLSHTLAHRLDPASRVHMEVTYEAIADAGIDACDLRGQRIGIFNATTADECHKIYDLEEQYLTLTSMRSMNPNRTTYAMGFTGPSIVIDTACSSTGAALWAAEQSIKSGCIEAAVVSGCQLNLSPDTIYGYLELGIQSPTGTSRPYDANGDGIVRAEAICAVFLQKAKTARRAYASVKATRFYSAGYVPEGIAVPSKSMQIEIMVDALKDAKVHPDEIQYVEGHATGTRVGDPIEANAMDCVFSTKTRKKPLLLGSVKSNIGHTEACAGLSSMIKSILAFETGLIPPNINYDSPNPSSPALLEGRVAIVTEPTPLTADYIPVNSLGFGGTLLQVVLKKNPRTYNGTKPASLGIPRMVLFPATTEEAITTVFDYVKNNPNLPEEFFALLSKLSFTDPFYKPFRGYAVYQKGKDPVTHIKHVAQGKRQVWFIMTGMGCQWPGMGLELMKIDVFARSINKSAEILKPYGIDLFEILRPDRNYFHTDRKITASFVAILSIQIALVDVLRYLGVEPDGIIGHSAGELGASYADGSCTHEQSLVASYFRGYAVESANLPEAGMAAVGMSFSEAEKMSPKDIFASCDNAEDSVTISGLKEPLAKFVEKLQQENYFVRMVNSHGYGFHSKFIQDAVPLMKPSLQKLIPNPKPRTERWISTSFPESQWNTPECKMCGPDYFCNNMVSSVRFTHALTKIPSDAIVIEIGPHYLLQSILKRAIGPKASYHGLMKRNDENNVLFFMESLGKLYQEGVNPKIERLYPPVKFPVPRGTPVISDLIKWNHTQSFVVPRYSQRGSQYSKEFKLDKDDAYLMDHGVDGRKLFPGTGYVYLAWDALATKLQKDLNELPVVIENFRIERATITSGQSTVKFFVNILDSSGNFEIIEGKSLVASGKIYECKKMTFLEGPPEYTSNDTSVSARDIYDELKRCSFEFGPAFQNLVEYDPDGTSGVVQWQGKWIPFLDVVLLFFSLKKYLKGLLLPTEFKTLKIDPNILREYVRKSASINKEDSTTTYNIPCRYNPKTKLVRSIGIEASHLNNEPVAIRGKAENPILEEYRFIPYVSNYTPSGSTSLPFSQYFNTCNELMNKIGKALKKNTKRYQFQLEGQTDFRLGETESSDNKNLAKILETISNDPESLKNKRKEYLANYIHTAGNDILNNALVNEDTLKIMLAIISENTYRKLSVVEVNRDFPVVLVPATDTVKKYAHLKFKKSVLIAPKSVVIDQEVLEESGIQQASSEDILKDLEREKSQDVAISSFTCGPLSELKNLLGTLTSIIKSNGFILLFFKEKANRAEQLLSSICGEELQVHSQAELESVLQSANLLILSKISDPFGGAVYLLRAPYLETPQKVLQITDSNYKWVEKVKKELYEKNAGRLWLVSEDGPVSGILGMVNCLKQEPSGERIRCVFISRKKQENNFPSFSLEHPFFQNLITKNMVMNVWKDGTWGSYRHILIKEKKQQRPMEHSYVNCRKYGDLSSFEWIESSVKYAPRENKKLVHIYYSTVNFKDVMLATGKLSIGTTPHQHRGNSVLGFEFSGREEGTGKRICGFAPARAMATSILAEPHHCLEVPENWTLEEAATVPVVYATCYYALITRAKLQPGESILIHSGSGGIGMAAITIALSMNCEVFTTVGNDEKRAYLKKKFPQIKEENIGCSRNVSFEPMILSRTNGRGVDVILNSLADDKFQANFRCIARNGRIVEIGKYDLALNRPIHSKVFLENVSFHAVFLDQVFDDEGKGVICDIMDMVRDGIKTGVVQTLDRTVFGRNAIEEAFRYMAKGVHIGKVLLKIRDEEPQKSAIPKSLILPAVPETQFFFNKVYIVIGGLGGFGIELTKWAMERGARNIILTSRYGARTPYHHYCLKRLKNEGLNIRVSTLNVAKRDEAEKLLQEAMCIGPIGGIFNSAVILKDAFMDAQTPEDYQEVCGPKSDATKFLDELTRKLCPDIDYFVCFSSISGGRGNAGQTNYAYANSVMERVCEERKKDGLHGLAIQWGIIGDVGVVHRHMGEDAMIAGVMAQSLRSCLQTLDIFCQQDCPVVTSYVAAEQSRKTVQVNAIQQILKILGVEDVSQINVTRSLGEIGIDSMVGVEIKQMIESYSDVAVSMQEIQEMKFDDIKAIFEKADSEKTTMKAPALMATTNIKLPPSLVHKDPLVVLNEQSSGEHVFIVHIKDTDVMSFQPLAKALNRPVYALVWTKDLPSGDMESLAQWYIKSIENITKGPYHLMGVSDGACLAFEMALQSERSQRKLKSLTLITGSEHLMNTLSVDSTEKTQSEASAVCGFIEQFTSSDLSRLQEELQKDLHLDQRIRTVFNYLTNSSSQMVNKNEVSEAIANYLLKHRLLESSYRVENFPGTFIFWKIPLSFYQTMYLSSKRYLHSSLPEKSLSTEYFHPVSCPQRKVSND